MKLQASLAPFVAPGCPGFLGLHQEIIARNETHFRTLWAA